MRWVQWIFQEPLAQMTFLAAVLTAVLLVLIVRKILTRGRSPAISKILYTFLAWLMFALPATYFWNQAFRRQMPVGPLLHSTPSATFHTADGRNVTLESLRGHVVLLDFWASWCAPCRQSSPAIVEMQRQYGSDLITVGVSVDETQEDFRKALNGARPTYDCFDDGQKLRWTFRVGPLPQFVVVNRAGAVDSVEVGWDPLTISRLHSELERNLAQR